MIVLKNKNYLLENSGNMEGKWSASMAFIDPPYLATRPDPWKKEKCRPYWVSQTFVGLHFLPDYPPTALFCPSSWLLSWDRIRFSRQNLEWIASYFQSRSKTHAYVSRVL